MAKAFFSISRSWVILISSFLSLLLSSSWGVRFSLPWPGKASWPRLRYWVRQRVKLWCEISRSRATSSMVFPDVRLYSTASFLNSWVYCLFLHIIWTSNCFIIVLYWCPVKRGRFHQDLSLIDRLIRNSYDRKEKDRLEKLYLYISHNRARITNQVKLKDQGIERTRAIESNIKKVIVSCFKKGWAGARSLRSFENKRDYLKW